MTEADLCEAAARHIDAILEKHGVALTLGGEPTLVPLDPQGPEWTVTALGPTKLRHAYVLGDALKAEFLPQALDFYCPGKSYPGEVNPRWAIALVWNRSGEPLVPALAKPLPVGPIDDSATAKFREILLINLGVKGEWLRCRDPLDPEADAWALPLDSTDTGFVTEDWNLGGEIDLLRTDGPAGLRLPLHLLSPDVSRRALAIETKEDGFHVFLPPFAQSSFLATLDATIDAIQRAAIGPVRFAGQIPTDERKVWVKLALAADPGVIEINLPPCTTWNEYRWWLQVLEDAGKVAELRSYKESANDGQLGTGGGNHLLFGGPSLDDHPFFSRPKWVTSILRYWQHHPSLAYLFTGQYVGPSSQAPRPDECAPSLYDLEMAYRFLEGLGEGDHRYLISETLRHLHTDASGNTHRSEASFDKFWNVNFDGGCRGLIEFRAVESLPKAEWMSAIALLWQSLAVWLLDQPFTKSLIDHGDAIHDRYFLPSSLISDFQNILGDLREAGFQLPAATFDEIIAWRFPVMLEASDGLIIRKALEGWPLLCETPLEGGSTSRFVDTSIERLEFSVPADFAKEIQVNGRVLPLDPLPDGRRGAGLRYRKSALYPCLHPGIPVQLPLLVSAGDGPLYQLDAHQRAFAACTAERPAPGPVCAKLRPELLTYDLRLS